MKYRVHHFQINMSKDKDKLESFLNNLKGGGRSSTHVNRSNVRNPNNLARKAAANNRSNQMNLNNLAYRSSRTGGKR